VVAAMTSTNRKATASACAAGSFAPSAPRAAPSQRR